MRRNAALALGRIGDPEAVEALKKAVEGDDVNVRAYAAEALKKIKAKQNQ